MRSAAEFRLAPALILALAGLLLAGCATRPVNPKLDAVDRAVGYRADGRALRGEAGDALIVLAFSGGGTRAAAYSYGVLEELRRTDLVVAGRRTRLIDEVDVISGVSGGSFTALAYALYGERLFDEYERRFLKRDVQGALIGRVLSPLNWPALATETWGRSDLAEQYYDEVLFERATFGDLAGRPGPVAIASATDLSTGSRLSFTQGDWDLICSDLSQVPLARAAAASAAVPLLLSPVTIDNYGGSCGYREPSWAKAIADQPDGARVAGRALQRYREMQAFQDGASRPYLHLVDGGLADNLGMRTVLESLETIEASRLAGRRSRFDDVRRIAVIVVNSLSVPRTDWDRHEGPPSGLAILLKAAGVPIDRYSYESMELLKDLAARWQERAPSPAAGGDAPPAGPPAGPRLQFYAIDVNFQAHPDPAERAYLNDLPTTLVLPDEAVDRLRAAAALSVRTSPEFLRLLRDLRGER